MTKDAGDKGQPLMDNPASSRYVEQWYRNVLDAINDGILVADEQEVVRYINPEYTRITGVVAEDILGRPLREVRPGAVLPQVIASGKAIDGVYRREGEIEYVVDMAPIVVEGKVAGGVSVVKDITEVNRLSQELQKSKQRTRQLKGMVNRMYQAKYRFEDVSGTSPQIVEIIRFAKKVAKGPSDILISGESGTGKEVFAQAIHNASDRREEPFVAVNCAAITPTLVEAELFGYDEGAFTGARKGGKVGLFEVANGGTIFLDEIGELNMDIQAKLLRVLQERSVRRVGEANETEVDIRVIAATNRDLTKLVREGRFRTDLYYRLNVVNVQLPALRERDGDSLLLAETFLANYSRKFGRVFYLSPEVKEILVKHDWPGNVRELRNVIEFAVNMAEESSIEVQHLPHRLQVEYVTEVLQTRNLTELVQAFERETIQKLLVKYGNSLESKRHIAKELGISVATLYNKLRGAGV